MSKTKSVEHLETETSSLDKLALDETVSGLGLETKAPPLGVPIQEPDDIRSRFRKRNHVDLDSIATQPSVFDDPLLLEIYRPPPAYENSHRFDPKARWTWREERSVVRKIDLKIFSLCFMMFFAMDLDRTNILQANADNFIEDLGMTTDDYNLGSTLYKAAFLIAELPSQILSKRIGPDVWIPTQMVLWSIVSIGQYWLRDRGSFLATRCLLGFLTGGFIPDVVLYLSYFYTKNEFPMRLGWFWVSNYLTNIVSAFLATGILRMRGLNGQPGWKYLFLIEGILTLLMGLFAFRYMPAGPTQTRNWFTERDEVIMVNRVLRDDPSKSNMHNREGLSLKQIWISISDWRMWPLFALGLTHLVPVTPPQVYLTLSLRQLGFSTTESNLLSIPTAVLAIILLVFVSWLTEFLNSRAGVAVLLQFWALPLLVVLYTFTEETSPWVYYVVVTLVVGYPYVHPLQVAWASRNSYSVGTRTVSASIYNMTVQAGGIIAANIYRNDDKPLYRRGNRILIGITVANIAMYALTYIFYRTLNAKRDKVWNVWTPEQRKQYLETTKDTGNARLDFRFAY